jgi:hypothetical protein
MRASAVRECAFCGGEIGENDPPEHVIPKWMGKFRPKGAVFLHTMRPEMRGDMELPAHLPEFRAKNFELTADSICARCNHGWMSDLETKSSPLLTPMIEGKAVGLDIERQVLVSTWVAKTALTFDQAMPPQRRLMPLRHCRWVKDHQLPPLGATVRLGRYDGDDPEFVRIVYDGLFREVPADPIAPGPPDGHRATIRIGQLVAEFTVTEDTKPVLRVRGGDIVDLLVTIWPTAEIKSWPPRQRFNDDTLSVFTSPDMPDAS